MKMKTCFLALLSVCLTLPLRAQSNIKSVPVYSYAGAPANGLNEVDTLTLTGTGSFTIGVAGSHATASITTGTGTAAVLSAIDTALEAHSVIGTGGVLTAAGTLTTGTGTVTITFTGKNAKQDMPLLSIASSSASQASISTTTAGVAATFPNAPLGTLLVDSSTPALYQNTSSTANSPTWVGVASGASAPVTIITGTTVLSSGSATVANTAVTAASRFSFAPVGNSPNSTIGLGDVTAGTGFIILSSSTTDTRVVHWQFTK